MTAFSFTTKASHIENSLEAVGKVRKRAILSVSEKSICFKTVDPQNISMCRTRIQNEEINQINIKDTTSKSEITIRPNELQPYLSPTNKNDNVTLAYHEDESTIEGQISTQNLEFTLPVHVNQLRTMSGTGREGQQIGRELNGFDLKQTVNLLSTIFDKDYIEFQSEESSSSALKMTAQNEDGKKISRSFEVMDPPTPGSSNSINREVKNLNTKIRIDYISKFVQLFGKSEKVTVHIGDSCPIRFELRLDNGVQIVYTIAPKREE
jgi:hypothetical protein